MSNLQKFIFGGYRLAVDVEKTRAYYAAHPLPWVTCDCCGCRNFVQAVKLLPEEVRQFFTQFGADIEKPANTSWYGGTQKTIGGDAWYHLCGEILERIEPEKNQVFGECVPVAEHFEAGFKPECWLLPEDFPKPCFQLEVFYQLPWVLEEPNPEAEQ